jgi:hypothetical protein
MVERNVSEEPADSMFRVEISTIIYNFTPPEDISVIMHCEDPVIQPFSLSSVHILSN